MTIKPISERRKIKWLAKPYNVTDEVWYSIIKQHGEPQDEKEKIFIGMKVEKLCEKCNGRDSESNLSIFQENEAADEREGKNKKTVLEVKET